MNKPKFKMKEADFNKSIKKMKKSIDKFGNHLWTPSNKIKFSNIDTNSWFSILESKEKKEDFVDHNYDTLKLPKVSYKSKKVTLILKKRQKDIINNWLNSYALMFNSSIKFIKNNISTDNKVLNFINLRKSLKKEKQKILQNSNIYVHSLDGAIKLACTMYKSALTNKKKGNIKTFRIRYWKKNKENKILDLEKINFTKKGIRPNILGKMKGFYNGSKFDFSLIDCDCKLQKTNGNYYLFVPEKIETKISKKKKNKQITLDPGIRTFLTGITENKVIKVKDSDNKIKNYLKRKDKIMKNKLISDNIKKKNEKMINRKITNLIEDVHWKTIKYLTDNNSTILMGNMSTKEISRKDGNLDKMSKRIGLLFKLYKFKERLKFKCSLNNVSYGEIDEWMTSKMCSNCGNVDKDLGSNKIYDCKKCKTIMDRDVNGARNIYIKAIVGK